ncbi:unnamed protein product, partial [Ixodes hexagonus]
LQVTYPRTGTHLVQQIIQLILNSGQSTRNLAEFTKRSPFLEIQGPQVTETPRLLRTHLPMHRLRLSDKAKYVYVARNPWDCCVSNLHFMKGFEAFGFTDGGFDDFLDAFLDGTIGFGDYFDHVLSGFRHRQDANVFFVTYEETVKNKADVVLGLADFLGEGYGEMVRSNRKVTELILEKSGFEYMHNLLQTNKGELMELFGSRRKPSNLRADFRNATEVAKSNFVRKGVVGDWGSYFSRENIQKMQDKMDEKFEDTDIPSFWMHEKIAEGF